MYTATGLMHWDPMAHERLYPASLPAPMWSAIGSITTGGWLIDTPGMRELRLSQTREGIDAGFADLAQLAQQCQFNDCQHTGEPGCAVQAAIQEGSLEQARLQRWQKLQREDAYFNRSAAELRAEKRSWKKHTKNGRAQAKMKNKGWGD